MFSLSSSPSSQFSASNLQGLLEENLALLKQELPVIYEIDSALVESACRDLETEIESISQGLAGCLELLLPCEVEVDLRSEKLGLSGRLDRLAQGCVPCIIRTGRAPEAGVWKTDRIMLSGYALLLGEKEKRHVPFGLVEYARQGLIRRVEIGLPQEPAEPVDWPLVQPVPDTLDYDQWLGYTPAELYSELRTHPQGKGAEADFGRPGWMTLRAYSMGMIANWGAHHIDIAHWGLGLEETGPVRIRGRAAFPKRRLWDVHGSLDMKLTYANGTVLHIADDTVYPNGVRFVGEKGWIFCGRGSVKTLSNDPGAGGKHGRWRPLEASARALIEGEVEHRLPRNPGNHHRIWLESIRTRQPTHILPESAHRTTTACILAFTAMNLKRGLEWDPAAERFVGDEEANATLARPERAPYGVRNALRRAGRAGG
ncbi:MAG: hypothetical protein BWY77_01282 [bacterium ADurb.Bin431]|nr:MAG: hypothetical protein BWY77_01282 [bacterium ADurb.Bin431]